MDNQPICKECAQKELSNQYYNNNAANYYNNFNLLNSNYQMNSTNYSQNLSLLNEMLKNNINRSMNMIPSNTVNNTETVNQSKMNNMHGTYSFYQPFNQMSNPMMNMQNMSNPQSHNIPNYLQNGQIPLSQMNPQQLMILSQMLTNEKPELQSFLSSSGANINSLNSMPWHNQIINNMMTKPGTTSTNSSKLTEININPSQDSIRNSLLNQLMINLNKTKNPSTFPSNAIPTNQGISKNIFTNLVDNDAYNNTNKYFASSQQFQSESSQIPSQSSLMNLVNKQNNITNLNFFNNLFNISQIQNSNTNTNNPNSTSNYLNENVLMNMMPNNINSNVSQTVNYQTSKNANTKSQKQKTNSKNDLEFVGANSFFNNLIANSSNQNFKRDVKRIVVDDNLLLKEAEKYEVDIKSFDRPNPKPLEIPQQLQNKVFAIWDFFHTFRKILDPENQIYGKDDISTDIEEFFSKIEIDELFLKFILSLLNLYLLYSYGSDPTEFEAEKGLLLLRTLKENINTNLTTITKNSWKEIFLLLTESKKFRLLVNSDVKRITKKFNDLSNEEESSFELMIEDRITILHYLVNSTLEINKIKDLVKTEFEKKNNLLREKVSLKLEYKNKDIRKKEIERSERFLKAPQMIEELNKKLQELEQNNPTANKILMKQKKEMEIERERYSSILKENIELQRVKDNIIERRMKIKAQLHEMIINNKRLIGMDAYKSEYFFFNNVMNKVYVKKIIEDANKDKEINEKAKETKWFYYSEKESIKEFINKLLEKGIKERKLKSKLKKILTKKMNFGPISNESESKPLEYNKEIKDEDGHVILETVLEPMIIDNDDERDLKVIEDKQETNELSLALEIIRKMDDKFSEYLAQYSKEWEEKELRKKWVNKIYIIKIIYILEKNN
jgi:hypothetical protein